MNVLLSCFDEKKDNNNNNLDILLCNYQDYFFFEKKNNKVYLYLRVDILKKYLLEGIEIKYKKFIFLFLENISNIKENKSYYFEDSSTNNQKNNNIYFNKYFNSCFRKYFNDNELIDQNKLFTLHKKYYEKKNKVYIKDKNIICLDINFYIDLNYGRYYLNNYIKKKHHFYYKGVVINNRSHLKNQLYTLLSIKTFENFKNINKLNNNSYNTYSYKNNFHLPTKCHLILCEKNNIESWIQTLKKIYPELQQSICIKVIYNYNSFKNISNQDIQNLHFLIININVISILNKTYINNYQNFSIEELVNTIIYENSYNINIKENIFKHLFLFHWEYIIIDNFEIFLKIESNLFHYLLSKNLIYYISSEKICEKLYNTLINNLTYNLDINEFNLYNFLKKELTFKNDDNKELINKVELLELKLNEDENIIANQFKEQNDNINENNKELSLLFIKSLHDNFHNISLNNMESILINYQKNNIQNIKYEIENKNYNNQKSNEFIISLIQNIKYNNLVSCCICMDNIEKNKMCMLECGHYFCKTCILIYKMNHSEHSLCPICRTNFNTIYSIDENIQNDFINNYSEKLKKIINIITNNSSKKILIVSEYDDILTYIYDKLINKFSIICYQNNKQFLNKDYSVGLITMNQLLKNNVYNIEQIIFIDITDQNYDKFIKIKIKYDDYYFDIKTIKYIMFYVKGFLLKNNLLTYE